MNIWISILFKWIVTKFIGFWFWTITGCLILYAIFIGYMNCDDNDDGSMIVKV